jgi:hypothetical protein
VQAKIIKLVGLKNGGRLSPINLVTFAGTQNGEYKKKHTSSDFFFSFLFLANIWPNRQTSLSIINNLL